LIFNNRSCKLKVGTVTGFAGVALVAGLPKLTVRCKCEMFTMVPVPGAALLMSMLSTVLGGFLCRFSLGSTSGTSMGFPRLPAADDGALVAGEVVGECVAWGSALAAGKVVEELAPWGWACTESSDDQDGLLMTDFFFLAICVLVGVSLKNLSSSEIFSAQLFLVQVLVLDTSASHNLMSTPISWSAAVAGIVPVNSRTSQW
jgi:hypothetical protein